MSQPSDSELSPQPSSGRTITVSAAKRAPSSQIPPIGALWRQTISNAKTRRLVSAPIASSSSHRRVSLAQASSEVNSGFRPLSALSFPSSSSSPASNTTSSAKSKGKGTARTLGKALLPQQLPQASKDSSEVPIHAIFFVPQAYNVLYTRVNNAGERELELSHELKILTSLEKEQLAVLGYARISTDQDQLKLDSGLDTSALATYFAETLFRDVYRLYCRFANIPLTPVPPNWFIQLRKHQRQLYIVDTKGEGATALQLIKMASTKAGNAKTKEIYLAVDVPLQMPEAPLKLRKRKARAKASESDSDSDRFSGSDCEISAKGRCVEASETALDTPAGSGPVLRPRLRVSSAAVTVTPMHAEAPSELLNESVNIQNSPTPTVIDIDDDLTFASASFSNLLVLGPQSTNLEPEHVAPAGLSSHVFNPFHNEYMI